MITIKHFLDPAEAGDGQRIWVEPIGLTRDLREWCAIDHVMSHLGAPMKLWEWFKEHPDGYEFFRGSYHETLNKGPYREALQQLACAGRSENFTLLHDGDDREHNTAAALHEFLSELQAYCPREPSGERPAVKRKPKVE
jgi:uncharacterized protein YeaO (DUF488 family)